jgi:hypothetical protein
VVECERDAHQIPARGSAGRARARVHGSVAAPARPMQVVCESFAARGHADRF